MSPDYIGEAIIYLGLLAVLLLVLAIGCALADYIFPKIPFIRQYFDSLPEFEDDKEIAELYECARQMESAERRRQRASKSNRRN